MNVRFSLAFVVSTVLLGITSAVADGVDEPIPSFYQEPGLAQNRSDVSQHPNERIDPFTGKLQWHFVDLYIPGNGGLDIKVQRSYSSLNEILGDDSPVGAGWTMHFGRVLRKASVEICALGQSATFNPVLELPDGSRQIMYDAPDGGSTITSARWKGTCAPSGGLIVQSPDGTSYEMTTPGPLVGSTPTTKQNTYYTTRITDRNGNTLDFTYNTMNGTAFGVQSIAASDGRTVDFTYTNGALTKVVGGGATWTYSLTPIPGVAGNQLNLDQVTRPDGTTWKYEYNPPGSGPGTGTPGGYSMKKVTYPTGGTINYTYGFVTFSANPSIPVSTVVSQKQTADGTWTYAYVPATTQIDFSSGVANFVIDPAAPNTEFDKTTMSGPEGSTVYLHIGYSSVGSGSVFLIGTLAGKISSSIINGQPFITEIDSYSWGYNEISSQANIRPGTALTFDNATYIPLMVSRSLSRNGQIYDTDYSNFDVYDNPQTITETGTDTRTTTVTYYTDPVKWILHQKKDETTDTIGAINRTFDPNGNMLTESRYGVTTTYTYSPEGDIATKKDARGNTTTYLSYMRGIPQTENQPEGVSITRVVSDAGNITSQTDGENATTSYGYDGLNRLTSITHPRGNPVTVTWAANTRTVTRGNYQEVVTFDGFGRQSQVQHTDTASSEVITQTYGYDALGRKIFASYPNDTIGTYFVYDILGETLGIYHGADAQGATHSSTRTFQFVDNTVHMTNERAYEYVYTYRAYGDPDHRDLMSITAPDPASSVTIERNGLGQMTQAVQDGVTRTYGYDGHYFLTSMTDPEVGTTLYGRDEVGNMNSRQVGASPTTTFGYDGRNRLKTITYPTGTPSVTRTYYNDDKPKSSDNGVARHDYIYDGNKNLTQETLTMTGQSPFVVGYSYDGNDALDVLTYGSGKIVTYSPDAFGRPTKALPYVTAVTHHPTGSIASMTYANGVQATIGLNARKWPNTLVLGGGTPIFNTTYTYDEAGNVMGIQDTLDPTYNRGLDYDPVDRLTTANGSWGNGTIGYNGHGDITSQALGSASSLTYTYDAQNRLATVSGSRNYTFGYDVYGNVTGNGVNSFTYNDASNMRCSNCGTGSEVDYDYDAGNMRVRSTPQGGAATYFVYGSSGNLLWELTPGVNLTEYIYLQGKQVATRQHTGG
jgi:YD repeat-containing protein